MYIQPGRPAFTEPQGGWVIIQSVTTATRGYEVAGQLFVYNPQQVHVSYTLKRTEVFFSLFVVVVINNNNNDN